MRAAGVPAVLAVAGGGPLRSTLQAEAAERGLPVRFLGHVTDRAELAALLATADVALGSAANLAAVAACLTSTLSGHL